jgi:hypothetical protein
MVLMVRSKQAILQPSSAEIHETLTMWIISGIGQGVHRRKRQKQRSHRNLEGLLQKRHGRQDFTPSARRLAKTVARNRLFPVSFRGTAKAGPAMPNQTRSA